MLIYILLLLNEIKCNLSDNLLITNKIKMFRLREEEAGKTERGIDFSSNLGFYFRKFGNKTKNYLLFVIKLNKQAPEGDGTFRQIVLI